MQLFASRQVHYNSRLRLIESAAILAGVDEAGRAPLAGPVSAGACILDMRMVRRRQGLTWTSWRPEGASEDVVIADSKRLRPEQREAAYAWITTHCAWGVAMVSAEEIDRIGILGANERAMQEAVAILARTKRPTTLLVDGRDKFWFDYPHISIVGGDGLEPAIAAASIIAKVTRDRWMTQQHAEFPQYGFDRHKGYPTAEHYAAIEKYGMCPLHRRCFLKNLTLSPVGAPL